MKDVRLFCNIFHVVLFSMNILKAKMTLHCSIPTLKSFSSARERSLGTEGPKTQVFMLGPFNDLHDFTLYFTYTVL